MADNQSDNRGARSTPDVTTLKEVERLLTSTEFASAGDLVDRVAPIEPTAPDAVDEQVEADGATPLPKRR